MITKLVVKDYVAKNCDYLTKSELEDKTLVKLLEDVASSAGDALDFLMDDNDDSDEDGDKDSVFNILDIFKMLMNVISYILCLFCSCGVWTQV